MVGVFLDSDPRLLDEETAGTPLLHSGVPLRGVHTRLRQSPNLIIN